ncbi:hypothetical protein V6N13_113669 [Hibiscus sabdariffa]|uniref:CONSTANS-like protein n=1 Tax=Hibiscus sabdariffa TaxID=183260 RepID=A0ABR2TZJ2_9ROSI
MGIETANVKDLAGRRGMAAKTCDTCKSAAAAIFCPSDSAFMCLDCDSRIHSGSNKLVSLSFLVPTGGNCQTDDAEPGSWRFTKLDIEKTNQVKIGDLFFSEMDRFVDFEYHHDAAMDSVVPVQTKTATISVINNEKCLDVDFCRSKLTAFTNSVPSSSVEVGVVPGGNSPSDASFAFAGTMDNNRALQALLVGGIDRKARVLRYREKRKKRKFEKTIRYASRKAYAESRPRIKGRFAKRIGIRTDNDADHMHYSTTSEGFMYDTQYGIVPS